ncbi:hypothetical protein E4U24_008469 [Claviceps purpurea]|nr:hypothetical protein E4U24_008469 [Claviceps purpurea]
MAPSTRVSSKALPSLELPPNKESLSRPRLPQHLGHPPWALSSTTPRCRASKRLSRSPRPDASPQTQRPPRVLRSEGEQSSALGGRCVQGDAPSLGIRDNRLGALCSEYVEISLSSVRRKI